MNKVIFLFLCISLEVFAASTQTKFEFAILGDAGVLNERTKVVRSSILKSSVRELILPGDNLYLSYRRETFYKILNWLFVPQNVLMKYTYGDVWDPWREDGFVFTAVALGNHNFRYDYEMKYFGLKKDHFSVYYHHNIKFIVVNSDNEKNISEQVIWLEKELKTTKEQFVFLVMHHPPFTISKKHHWQERKEFHERSWPIIERYKTKITALLLGHDHFVADYKFGDIPAVVSGSAYYPRAADEVEKLQRNVAIQTKWTSGEDLNPYWARLFIDLELGKAQIQFIRADTNEVKYESWLN